MIAGAIPVLIIVAFLVISTIHPTTKEVDE